MKRLKQILLAGVVMTVATSGVFAACPLTKSEAGNVQSYAHPTLFTDATAYSSNNGTYMVGGQIQKSKNAFGFANKSDVLIEGWAKDVLNLIETSSAKATNGTFDPKLPVLRSELAVIMAEAFALNQSEKGIKEYSDVPSDYWAASWIYKALNSGIMIGYPSNQFRPDQRVTKAEVFATIAQIIDTPYQAGKTAPTYKGNTMQYVPTWAYNCTKEVVASNLLASVPDQGKIVTEEYLSKEQVAFLVSAVRNSILFEKNVAIDQNAPVGVKNYQPVLVKMVMKDRVDAKHSTTGDTFTARTTNEVTIGGNTFPVNSIVRGEVVQVQRPGLNQDAFIKVKFTKIKNGSVESEFPAQASDATAMLTKNPNIIARILGAPLTASARVLGVSGRGIGEIADVTGNRVEELGDNLSNVLVETFTLHPGSGIKSLGGSVATVGKGLFDYTKIITSGVFGILYEAGDEIVYLFYPKASNHYALNPDEEISVLY